MNKIAFALPLSLALAACGSADEPPTDLDSAESDGAAAALARNIEAGEFLDLELCLDFPSNLQVGDKFRIVNTKKISEAPINREVDRFLNLGQEVVLRALL